MADAPKENNMQELPIEDNVPPPATPKCITIPEEEFEQVKQTAEEYKDKYLRLLAEMDNARKRLQKERHELVQHSIQSIMVEFLNPIDQMENALKYAENMTDEVKHWAFGFQMILTQLKDVLAIHGVIPFTSDGEHFDPHYHEAIEMIETKDFSPGTVVCEIVRGYKMGDKVIRPARVKVAKLPEISKNNESNGK